jgi:WD40 repeat protein
VSFSSDSKRLATTSWDARVLLWDMRALRLIPPPLTGHRSGVHCAVFSEDGRTLVSEDGTSVLLWSVATHMPMLHLEPRSLLFALPNGILTMGESKKLEFLKCPTLEEIDQQARRDAVPLPRHRR